MTPVPLAGLGPFLPVAINAGFDLLTNLIAELASNEATPEETRLTLLELGDRLTKAKAEVAAVVIKDV